MYDELINELRDGDAFEICGAYDILERAADAIEELTDSNVGKWIPVTERLPEKTGKYLVCGQWRGKPSESWVCELIAFGKIKGWDNEARNPAVTHWMPLPEPPEGGAGE